MKRRFMSLVYLVSTKEKPILKASNISLISNKIPCHHQDFFKLTSAQLHVIRQLSQYPSSQNKQIPQAQYPRQVEEEDDAAKLSVMLTALPSNLEYLKVQQARDWLKQLTEDSLVKNKQNLKLLQQHLIETINQGSYQSFVELSVLLFIEEISRAEQRIQKQGA